MKDTNVVYVGLSGGVDSSVSATRLLDRGYTVVGVFIKTWQPDFVACTWKREREDAMRVAAPLGIPFMTFDAVDTYRDTVAEYMVDEYRRGRTPNPDVMCNAFVKFGAFLKFALARGGKIATGHYAQTEERNGLYYLLRGADKNKDQTYFLWQLTQNELSNVLFPVGDSTKSVIRKEAEVRRLPTFEKRDSQGICFLGSIDIRDFLSHYVSLTDGDVLSENGSVIGRHHGALTYTIGQRHGFEVYVAGDATAPRYVIGKDIEKNRITVSTKLPTMGTSRIIIRDCNLISGEFPENAEAQFRYRQSPFHVSIQKDSDGTYVIHPHDTNIEMPSRGQSCVLYDGEICLGGGIIDTIL